MSLKIQQKMLKIVTVLLLLFFNLTFSQNYWNKAPYIGSGGVIEIGKYIDFHEISADQSDYSVRLYSDNGVLTSNRSMNINGEVRTKTLVVDDPIRVTNWNELWQSGFYESHEATNAPEPYNWFWGVVMNHSTDNPAYKYSGQIAIKNGYD
ncbi:hypothetical protein, partial [Joostella sp. CR20]|uniref:hypothetical protein n=1 Tax=Joostella sp. CR20 TaxID=2804312 RepID=UPI00313BDCCC